MAHKLLAPFKQLPIFKKSSDKWKEISLSNYNAVYGMLDDVTSQSFDEKLHLFAVGTKRGEIKIYGSDGVVYTLIGTTLKQIKILRFLYGQGRLLSVTCDNEIILWEFNVELWLWEIASTIALSSIIPNSNIITIDVSHPLSWKNEDNNFIQLLLIGLCGSRLRQALIIGNHFHIYNGDDTSVDAEVILSRCKDIGKEYEFGEILSINFNTVNDDRFFVAFNNGLCLLLKSNLSEPKSKSEAVVIGEIEETTVALAQDVDQADNEVPVPKEQETIDVAVEAPVDPEVVNEPDKPKSTDDSQQLEAKVEVKSINESIQVPFLNVKMPTIVNYVLRDQKISGVCWSNDDVMLHVHESCELSFYHESEVDCKLEEPKKIIPVKGAVSHSISNLSHFTRDGKDMFSFIAKSEDQPDLLCIMIDDDIAVEFETPDKIVDYAIVRDVMTDDQHPLALLIRCEYQLIALDLTCPQYTELVSPYLVFRTNSPVTAVTSIIQASSDLFSTTKTFDDIFQHWPLKTQQLSAVKTKDETVDILATGHSDGAVNIWQVMSSGVLSLLTSVTNKDLFKDVSPPSHSSTEISLPRRRVGHRFVHSDDDLLRISNIELIPYTADADKVDSGLFCVAGNSSGTAFVFKYDRSEVGSDLVEMTADLKDCQEKDGVLWKDTPTPEMLDRADISSSISNLCHIVRLNPSLPVTALAFHSHWNMLAIGCAHGLVLVDLKQNSTVFSYSTLARTSKNNVVQAPLTVGQQLRKSMRQSFKKLKKLKPSGKQTSNETKSKDKDVTQREEQKPEEDNIKTEVDQKVDQEEDTVIKEKTETSEQCVAVVEAADTESEPPIEISRKDTPSGTVGSLLIVATSLLSSLKEPCLFVGTNMGAIYAFDVKFGLDGLGIVVTLSKELHLQHKAPVLLMAIVNTNHVPLSCSAEIHSYQRKCSVVEDKVEEIVNNVSVTESALEVGPSGDSEDAHVKLKAGTLPAPQKTQENDTEKHEPGRKSVDAGKDKIMASPSSTMKKSGTLPATFLQAIGKTPGSADAHELLVVSEEQVKLFSLPTLKAKFKYKVVDTGHHYNHAKSSASQDNEQNCQDKKPENVDSNNIDSLASKKQIRRISAVGLCKMQGLKQAPNKWGVSVALTNGEIVALSLSNLKKYLSNLYNTASPILTSVSSGETNLVVSFTHQRSMKITDFSQTGVHRLEPAKSILIPEEARPVVKVEEKPDQLAKTNEPDDETESVGHKTESPVKNGHMNGHAEVNEMEENTDQLGDKAAVQNTSTTHHGDVTMDSIKEYITNMDGNVTVKTFESSVDNNPTDDAAVTVTPDVITDDE